MSEDTTDVKPAKGGEESDEAILKKAREHYKMCESSDSDSRNSAKDDLRFLVGGENQWDTLAVAARKSKGRPIITVNDLPAMLHQVTNDQRLNRRSLKVHPVDDNADVETAKVEQGAIRHIEYDSNADYAQDRAVNSAAAVGFGYWFLETEYESETSFNQKIVFRSVRDALSVRIDPLSTEPDGSDMGFAFVESLVNRADFKREHPDANANNTSFLSDESYAGWLTQDAVLVCRYWCIKKTPETVVLLSNGESGFKSDLIQMPAGVTVVKEREGERRRVMLYKITGTDVLEKTEVKSKWVPVFPVYGDEIVVDGKVIRSGIIRNAKGPCQSYNVMISAATEEVASRTKAPWVMAEGQDEGHEDEFLRANVDALPYVTYKPTSLEGELLPPPQRTPMADIPAGMLAMAMHAQDNKKKTTGLFDASLGSRGSATSGKQEIAQQREGDVANFHYQDGLDRTLRHCGRCIAYMFPHYYDTERTVRILGDDDTLSHAKINTQNAEKKKSKDGVIRDVLNNVADAKFDITISTGPSYSTARQENAEFFANAMTAAKDPATAAVVTYLAMRNQDAPGSDEAAEMLKALLPPNIQEIAGGPKKEGEEEGGEVIQTPRGPLPVAQVPKVLEQLEQQLAGMEEAIKKAGIDKIENDKAALEIKRQEADTKRFEAETARMQAEAQADEAQAKLMLTDQQQQVDARVAELQAVNGDTTAFEAWKTTLESETKIRVAEIMARSSERRAAHAAASAERKSAMTKAKPNGGAPA